MGSSGWRYSFQLHKKDALWTSYISTEQRKYGKLTAIHDNVRCNCAHKNNTRMKHNEQYLIYSDSDISSWQSRVQNSWEMKTITNLNSSKTTQQNWNFVWLIDWLIDGLITLSQFRHWVYKALILSFTTLCIKPIKTHRQFIMHSNCSQFLFFAHFANSTEITMPNKHSLLRPQ